MMVINTPTIEDYIEVVEWATDQNMVWNDKSKSIYEEYWESYNSETCIIIEYGTLSYGDRDYVIRNYETKILDMAQFHKLTREDQIKNFGKKFNLR